MSPIIQDWTPEKERSFGSTLLAFRHNLHERPMFSDEGLVSILDRYPRERLGVFTMGHDIADVASWRRAAATNLSGDQLIAQVQAGRLWLNLRHADRYLPEFADMCGEIASEKERHARTKVRHRDLGLLISSPNAEVFFHLDVPLSSLWQVRGEKRFLLYPRAEPFVSDEQIERCVLREAEGQFPYQPSWDEAAQAVTMTPGVMLTWPQNQPHRVSNGPMMNVSVSMEFMTPPATVRSNVLYANSVLRRRFGLTPKVQDRAGPTMAAKLALAAGVKAAAARKKPAGYTPILKPSFEI